MRKASCPVATRRLISAGGSPVSFTPVTQSMTNTRLQSINTCCPHVKPDSTHHCCTIFLLLCMSVLTSMFDSWSNKPVTGNPDSNYLAHNHMCLQVCTFYRQHKPAMLAAPCLNLACHHSHVYMQLVATATESLHITSLVRSDPHGTSHSAVQALSHAFHRENPSTWTLTCCEIKKERLH